MGFDFDTTFPRIADVAVTAVIGCSCKGGVWHEHVCATVYISFPYLVTIMIGS